MKQLNLFARYATRLPKTQYDAVIYFMARLDIEMVSDILDRDKTYQDFPKDIFISKLVKAFEKFQDSGDKALALHKGRCAGCSNGCRGFTFQGSKGLYMDILFLTDNGKIKDIYECSLFVNEQKLLRKLIRVKIDPKEINANGDFIPF